MTAREAIALGFWLAFIALLAATPLCGWIGR